MRKAARVVIRFMLFVVLTLGVGLVVTPDAKGESHQPVNKAELAKRLIVKVTGENNFGAGIIFGVRGGYLFIATANHVAQRGVNEVEFEFLRGVPLNVELIHSYPKLDLAVLRVNVQESRFQEAHVTLPFDQISAVSNVNRGDAVYPVGHPEGDAWDIPLTPSTVKKAIAEEIYLEPTCFPGNSGGGLFDEQWNLIGMVIRARARSCEAVSFERIRATLEDDWGLEVDREPLALGPTEPPEIPEETPDQEADTQEEEKQQKIAQLLEQANVYFERQWYTTPEETNAFDVYREVLKLDPTNEHAYRQIDKIAKFYKSRAEREVKQGRAEQAIQFYRKYLKVVPNDEEILDKVAELEKPTPIPTSTPTPPEIPQPTPSQRTSLRSEPLTVSEEEAQKVFKLNEKWMPLEYIQNDFEDRGDVVIDHATGLMWQKSGSDEPLVYKEAQAYIEKLNRERFAGYNDWRLPTVDEFISLLEPEKQSNGLYINPIFDAMQRWCWSADKRSSGAAWLVYFDVGIVYWSHVLYNDYVRVVRSRQ